MHRCALVCLFVSTLLLPAAAAAQIEIDGLNHYLCHKAKDSKFHPDKFPRDAGRDPASVVAVEMRDGLADGVFAGVGQLYDFKKYKGVCAAATKEKITPSGTSGDGTVFPLADGALHLVDLQVKQSKKDATGAANPAGTFEKLPKGTQRRVVTQFFDEVVELKRVKLALIGADMDDHGPTLKCKIDSDCTAIDPASTCQPATGTCLPPDPLAALPGTARSGPNYLCYKVKQAVKQPGVLILAGGEFTDGVTDPDEPLLFSVSKMTRLCLAADKASENPGAEDGFDHLACYKTKQATRYADVARTGFGSATGAFPAGKPPRFKKGTASVQTFNFGQRVLDVKGAGEFCTPAFVSTVGTSDGIPLCGDGEVYGTPGALFEQCDDGNTTDGDGCSSTCTSEGPVCGDGLTEGLEECDDGNTVAGDGCSDVCVTEFCGDGTHQPLLGEACDGADDASCPGACNVSCGCGGPPGPFRINTLALADPPIFSGASDLTAILNLLLATTVSADADPADGIYDLSLLTLLRPPGGAGTLDLGVADCTFPSPTTCSPQDPLDPLAGFTSATYASFFTGNCISSDPSVVGPNNNGAPSVPLNQPVAGTDGCAIISPVDVNLSFLGLALPLQQVEVAASYSGTPATSLFDGLLFGFLAETDAAAITLPADVPLVGGQPLTDLLRISERDTGPGGALGWWFHLNFTAEGASWTGP